MHVYFKNILFCTTNVHDFIYQFKFKIYFKFINLSILIFLLKNSWSIMFVIAGTLFLKPTLLGDVSSSRGDSVSKAMDVLMYT